MNALLQQGVARSQYLAFRLDATDFAIPILKVKEIVQFEGLTPVPGAPGTVRGVLNLRGGAVPVVDLRARFGAGETPTTRTTCVLVVETEQDGSPLRVGLLADSVREVIDAAPDDVEPPPRLGSGASIDWLVGMTRLDHRFCLVLNVDRALASDPATLRSAIDAATVPQAAGP